MTHIQFPSEKFIKSLAKKKSIQMDFLSAGEKVDDLPLSHLPEVAIVGRSNVGKSSFINFISGRNQLARVSHTPGRTQTINLFGVDDKKFIIADLPGYGYAESPKEKQEHWAVSLKEYFEKRPGLFGVLFLIDIRRDIHKEDILLARWFQQIGIHVVIVETKCDKLSKNLWFNQRKMHATKFQLPLDAIITTSADKKIGLESVLQQLAQLLELAKITQATLDEETK